MTAKDKMIFRSALNTSTHIEELDTASIQWATDYTVLELLLSTLVEFNNKGEIIGGLAQRYFWNDNDLIFEFRNTAFSFGAPVTPEDAITTLKRLMILNTNLHGELADFLSMNERPRTLNDSCDAIRAEGQRLILRAKMQSPFLVTMLTSLDYGILRKDTIDQKNLKILSFEDTCGPYRLTKINGKNYLTANKDHWHYHPQMPQTVELVPNDHDENSSNTAEKLFIRGEVDFIPTASEIRLKNIANIESSSEKKITVHQTTPMALALAKYTLTGLALPINTRRQILACINRAVKKHLANEPSCRITTLQVLPPDADGSLSQDQLKEIDSGLQNYHEQCNALGIRIAVPQFLLETYEQLLDSEANNFTLIGYPDVEHFEGRTDKDVPELTITGVDFTQVEHISSISFGVKNRILVPPDNQSPADWLKQYFSIPEKSMRMALLQKINFYTVWEDPRIVPITYRPFFSVIDSRWTTDFSNILPNDPYWRIRLT